MVLTVARETLKKMRIQILEGKMVRK
jgi:hypothetical protein